MSEEGQTIRVPDDLEAELEAFKKVAEALDGLSEADATRVLRAAAVMLGIDR